MINIFEILKKIPNLGDMVFYTPLYGDVKVAIFEGSSCPIYLQDVCVGLTEYGLYGEDSNGERECMLYPSRQNRDWSTFKIPRKDLPKGTSVMVSNDSYVWELREYSGSGHCFLQATEPVYRYSWKFIIPVNKFNFNDWSFKEEDNYGTAHKE